MTMHRAENVDIEERLRALVEALALLHDEYGIPVICSLHPRTRSQIEAFGVDVDRGGTAVRGTASASSISSASRRSAFCVLSDSGTVQEEACIFGVPNVTIRDVTERPETVECGIQHPGRVRSGCDRRRRRPGDHAGPHLGATAGVPGRPRRRDRGAHRSRLPPTRPGRDRLDHGGLMAGRGRHVLIFSVVFPPDNVSTAHLVGFLADDLTAAGHRITVITTTPHSRPEPEMVMPAGRVIRIPVPHKGTSALRNAFIWTIYLVGALWAGMLRAGRPDVVLAVTPPPGIGLIGSWVARRWRAPLIYNVKELYPDVAVALGVLDKAPAVAAMRWVENRAFRHAAVVTAITPAVADRIRSRGGKEVEVIPDCVDLDEIVPGSTPHRSAPSSESMLPSSSDTPETSVCPRI